jgi:hypothetical protein
MSFPVIKDPDADLDYAIDWSDWLAADDSIVTSKWAAPADSGLVVHDDSLDPTSKKATVWIGGGVVGREAYRVTNSIVTAAGRAEDRSLLVTVRER